MSENPLSVSCPVVFCGSFECGGPSFGYIPEEFFEKLEAEGIVVSAVKAVGAYCRGELDAIVSER